MRSITAWGAKPKTSGSRFLSCSAWPSMLSAAAASEEDSDLAASQAAGAAASTMEEAEGSSADFCSPIPSVASPPMAGSLFSIWDWMGLSGWRIDEGGGCRKRCLPFGSIDRGGSSTCVLIRGPSLENRVSALVLTYIQQGAGPD